MDGLDIGDMDIDGHIPSSIVNWATKSGIPGFLRGIQDACLRRAATTGSSGPKMIIKDRPETPDSGIEA
ncbi:hypothetical protein BGZ81_001883 [Podila clonocystis]|nr:hypothetical protein BGZ81_001883 [Podila clonocystis]